MIRMVPRVFESMDQSILAFLSHAKPHSYIAIILLAVVSRLCMAWGHGHCCVGRQAGLWPHSASHILSDHILFSYPVASRFLSLEAFRVGF